MFLKQIKSTFVFSFFSLTLTIRAGTWFDPAWLPHREHAKNVPSHTSGGKNPQRHINIIKTF